MPTACKHGTCCTDVTFAILWEIRDKILISVAAQVDCCLPLEGVSMVVEGVATDYENKTLLAANDQGQSVTTRHGILRTLSSSWRRHSLLVIVGNMKYAVSTVGKAGSPHWFYCNCGWYLMKQLEMERAVTPLVFGMPKIKGECTLTDCQCHYPQHLLQSPSILLWPPCVADADIVFLPCDFFFLSFYLLFSSPNLSGRRLDVCHTFTHGVALVRI